MKLAHITDMHLRHHLPGTPPQAKRHSRDMPQMFAAALQQIVESGAEAIAVTGDLLDVPEFLIAPIPDFPAVDEVDWQRRVLADYELVRSALEATGLPWMVLPGNHDHEGLMWQVFDHGADVLDVAGVRLVRFIDREHECHIPRRYDPSRRRWEQMLADEGGPWQVHLQHYVVTPPLNEHYPHTYEEGEHIARHTAASGRVSLSLSGHYHPGTDVVGRGGMHFTTAPAFCQPPFIWRLYEIDEQRGEVTMQKHSLGAARRRLRSAVFVDRDGTLSEPASYRGGAADFRMHPGAGRALRALGEAGFVRIMVSSQNAVGRGFYPRRVVDMTNDHLARALEQEGGAIDGIRYSASEPDPARAVLASSLDHSRAKPSPRLLHSAAEHRRLDLTRSFLIGDRLTDIEAALAAGVQPILVRTGRGGDAEPRAREAAPDLPVVDDITAAAALICQRVGKEG